MPKVYTSRDINSVLRQQLASNKAVKVGGIRGHHAICVAVEKNAKVTVEGSAGDFFGALNRQASIILVGRANNYAGDSMTGGELLLEGEVGAGVAACLGGGAVVVKGSAAEDAGAGMRDGTLIVDGNAGDCLGRRMLGGTIIVTGKAGKDVGRGMRGGEIYVASDVGGLGRGASISEASHEEKKRIGVLLDKYGIKAKLALFEKVSPAEIEDDMIRIVVEGVE